MKKTINTYAWLLIAALSLFTYTTTAQPLAAPPEKEELPMGPTTTIEFAEMNYNFGQVEEGTIVSQVFTFTNTGDEPLILSGAKGSCGCTVPQWPREAIQPGETASITVEFNSKHKKGMRNQKVTITANTDPSQSFVYLSGEVLPGNDIDTSIPDGMTDEVEVALGLDCFAIYPNPTAEVLKLDVEERSLGQSATISIHANTGQLMAKRELASIDGTIEFGVAHYPAGRYIATLQIGDRKPEARCFVVVD